MNLIPALLLLSLVPTAAMASPMLRAEVEVTGPIVTVGDMFDDAGALAATPLFRSPAPGTSGPVPLTAVKAAAKRAGLSDYATDGVAEVLVSRSATVVDGTVLAPLVVDDLRSRNLVPADAEVALSFTQAETWNAEAVADPVR